MIDEICHGWNDLLSARYIQLLEMQPEQIRVSLHTTRIDDICKDITNKQHFEQLKQPITPLFEPQGAPKRTVPPALKGILQLLRSAAPHISNESREHALQILLQLCLDESVMSDAAVLQDVQEATEEMLVKIAESGLSLQNLANLVLPRITHPVLQNKLVLSLPARSATTASFRQHLALAFLLYPVPLNISPSNPKIYSLLHEHLETSRNYKIDRATDYSTLAARLYLLDVGIGPGPTTMLPSRPQVADSAQIEIPRSFSLSPAETAFNKEVDALTERIRLLGNRIVGAGALSDLTRLDAKDNCERLRHRLSNAVRIGGPKKRDPFEARENTEMFENFFSRKVQEESKSAPVNEPTEPEGSKRLFSRWLKRRTDVITSPVEMAAEAHGVNEDSIKAELAKDEMED
jgi:hypothetical protein